jgi:hypothetical protein
MDFTHPLNPLRAGRSWVERPPKYWVSWATLPLRISVMLTAQDGWTLSPTATCGDEYHDGRELHHCNLRTGVYRFVDIDYSPIDLKSRPSSSSTYRKPFQQTLEETPW